MLKTRGPHAIRAFYDALIESGQNHLAALLEESDTIARHIGRSKVHPDGEVVAKVNGISGSDRQLLNKYLSRFDREMNYHSTIPLLLSKRVLRQVDIDDVSIAHK